MALNRTVRVAHPVRSSPVEIVVRADKEAEITEANLRARTSEQRERRGARGRNGAQRGARGRNGAQRGARGRNGAQRGARPSFLQKTRRPHARNRIGHRLPSKYPARHRKTKSRVTQMHEPHKQPQPPNRPRPQGRISITIGKLPVPWKLDKAHRCHLRSTEVIENFRTGLRTCAENRQ
jgi:hypothetical protein